MTNSVSALHESVLVGVHRSVSDDVLEGFVIESGDRWLLLARLNDDLAIDGHTLIRWRHVTKVRARARIQELVENTLRRQGSWPPRRPAGRLDLNDTATMFADLVDEQATVTVLTEAIDEDVAFVGVPVSIREKSLSLWEIDYTGSWRDAPSLWRFKDITRIDIGDLYAERVLEEAIERGAPAKLIERLRG